MAWELLAIWIIVAATVVWFVRDERRERAARLERQALSYATAPAWRHRESAAAPAPALAPARSDTIIQLQRRFLDEVRRQGR